jgi:aminopeptidase N
LAHHAESTELLTRLKTIDQHILSAYFFRAPRPRIELHWMAIGLFTATIGVRPESLTVVVAAHELAHAYTHLGRDIDCNQWDTGAFARSDLALVEGLTQFYARVICDHLGPRMPETKTAFDAFLKLQGPAYQVHQD